MKRNLLSMASVAMLLMPMAAIAGEKVATIEVSGLYCSSCPYIAAQAIMAVPSANITDGYYDPGAQIAQFVVHYDDSVANLSQLIAATSDYGYPAREIEAITPPDNS